MMARSLSVVPGEDLAEVERLLRHVGAHEQGAVAGVAVAGLLPVRQHPEVLALCEGNQLAGAGLAERTAVVVLAEHRRDAEHPPELGIGLARVQPLELAECGAGRLYREGAVVTGRP